MSSLMEIQKQLLSTIAEAKAQGYKLEDVIPQEMQDHFQDMNELKAARAYIKEVEGREKDLQAEINILLATLKEKEVDIENQPAEFKALKVDLQQAQRSVDLYKELSEDAQRRAQRYQDRLAAAIANKVAMDEVTAKVDRLQVELTHHQVTILRLQNENKRAADAFDSLRAKDVQTIASKDAQLAALSSHASQIESESEQFSETYTALIDSLETEHSSAAAAINDKSILLRKTEKLYNIVVSEVTPLNRFYTHVFQILGIYQALFRTLSDPSTTDITHLPQQLDILMSAAAQDLEIYDGVHGMLSGEVGGAAEEQIRAQISGIGESAQSTFMNLRYIKEDVGRFLGRLHQEPKSWLAMKARFGMSGKGGKRFSMA